MKPHYRLLTFCLLFIAWLLPSAPVHAGTLGLPPLQGESPTPTPSAPTPAEIIEAVNNLRLSYGLYPLSIHPVLMQVAAEQANALAASEGAVGHERPCGMTLGEQLLSMGYPLLGDLTMDGYRSENWVTALTIEDAISYWLGDDEHTNTMLSPNRSDIGAAVAVGDQTYVVLETAWSTSSGKMQYDAYRILTGIPMTQSACMGMATLNADGSISQYSMPVAVSTARPDGDVVHEVKYGQTLWSLADQYKVSVEQIKRLNGLAEDTIVPGWKLLIQKAATQPAPVTATLPTVEVTETGYPTSIPFHTATLTVTPTIPSVPVGQFVKQNSTIVVALLVSFSVLVAGLVGIRKKKE